jgi:hypothetical protein
MKRVLRRNFSDRVVRYQLLKELIFLNPVFYGNRWFLMKKMLSRHRRKDMSLLTKLQKSASRACENLRKEIPGGAWRLALRRALGLTRLRVWPKPWGVWGNHSPALFVFPALFGVKTHPVNNKSPSEDGLSLS